MHVASVVFNFFTNDSRVEKQANSLGKTGHEVTVFALWNNGLEEEETKEGFKIRRIRLFSSFLNGPFGRFIKFLEFNCRVSWKIKKTDIVHCHDYHPLPAMLLANLFLRSKFYVIYDAHEYESQKMGLAKTGRLTIQFLEKVSSHFVDGFITVSGSILKKYQNIYSNNPKTLILNCPPRWNKVSKNLFRKKFKISEESLVALYQGGFMPGRAIEILAKAFQIIDVKNLDFVFMGYPASSEAGRNSFSKIMKISQEFENIHFHESVNSNILHEFTGSADLGFCLIEDLCLSYRYCLPNKFFEYAMAGLPLLVSDLPEMRKLVEQYDCGVVCESLTPDGIVNGLKKLLSRDLVKLGKNARKMAEDHSWEVQEEKLLRLYDKVLHKNTT
jgi:glycosyltransferase involved in cell wall biosynthesis